MTRPAVNGATSGRDEPSRPTCARGRVRAVIGRNNEGDRGRVTCKRCIPAHDDRAETILEMSGVECPARAQAARGPVRRRFSARFACGRCSRNSECKPGRSSGATRPVARGRRSPCGRRTSAHTLHAHGPGRRWRSRARPKGNFRWRASLKTTNGGEDSTQPVGSSSGQDPRATSDVGSRAHTLLIERVDASREYTPGG